MVVLPAVAWSLVLVFLPVATSVGLGVCSSAANHVDVAAPVAGNGVVRAMRWTNTTSGFVLRRMAALVSDGSRPEKVFKDKDVNSVAKALKQFCGEVVSPTQVYNHLRKWRQKWARVSKLKDLSAALWDDQAHAIMLEQEHYLGHCKDHPKDAEFLNCPIRFYTEMEAIFANAMATGKFALGSGEALGQNQADSVGAKADGPPLTHTTGNEVFKDKDVNSVAKALKQFCGEVVSPTQVYNHLRKWRQKWARVSKLKDLSAALWDDQAHAIMLEQEHYLGHCKDHPKDAEFLNCPIRFYTQMEAIFANAMATRKRGNFSEEEMLMLTNMSDAVNNVANALRETGPAHVDANLYLAVMEMPGFSEEALIVAYTFLPDNKAQGGGFVNMSDAHRGPLA
ncbi:unnamed protein product [Miscanthus lutarioriparius]|uniref:Myb/SANT-like domain-containing protein n=1 Tax=Miscanthus lutarioriparius TaxID=422564 RepID=A0A811RX09_9POAL|nr:unnamed protein product [Miscanthus lutarioriparius]